MKLYVIKDWFENYESPDNRKTVNALDWYKARTKMDGLGFVRMAQEKDAASLWGAWNLIVMVAANQKRPNRGMLARGGVPLTPDDLELMTRFPAKLFERALEFFSDNRIGWLVAECPEASGRYPELSGDVGTVSRDVGTTQDSIPSCPSRLEESRREESRREESRVEPPAVSDGSLQKKSAIQLRAEKLHNKRESTPWDKSELAAWKAARAVVEATTEDEWRLLEWFYAQPQGSTYARTELATTLNHWAGELSKAAKYKEKSNGLNGALFR